MATPRLETQDSAGGQDPLIADAEERAAEEGATRNLFDLRMIIGGLFVLYGAYLSIRGLADSSAAIEQAAGVRINLWTGLGALAVGLAFIAWALLRPLTLEQLVEGTADDVDHPLGHEGETAARPRH